MFANIALIIALISVIVAAPADPARADFRDGWQAYLADDFGGALDEWLPLAQNGDLDALYNVAALYESGVLGEARIKTAIAYYKQAAERHLPAAQTRLARLFESGGSVERNHEKSIDWYRQAAARGVAEAQYNLGVAYERGVIIAPDVSQASQLYRKAANQGLAAAQYNLGRLYYHGEGVPKDTTLAVSWYRKAAEAGFAPAQTNLGHMYENGIDLARDVDAAMAWYRRAAEQGFARAQTNLGILLGFGLSGKRDYGESFRWFLAAALQGDTDAQTNLALMFANGLGVERNGVEAYAWLTVAAESSAATDGPIAETALAYRKSLAKRLPAEDIANGEIRVTSLRGELSRVQTVITRIQPRETAAFAITKLTIQRRLATLNYYDGVVDALIGPASREAILAFQTAAGIKADGRATEALLTALDEAVDEMKEGP